MDNKHNIIIDSLHSAIADTMNRSNRYHATNTSFINTPQHQSYLNGVVIFDNQSCSFYKNMRQDAMRSTSSKILIVTISIAHEKICATLISGEATTTHEPHMGVKRPNVVVDHVQLLVGSAGRQRRIQYFSIHDHNIEELVTSWIMNTCEIMTRRHLV